MSLEGPESTKTPSSQDTSTTNHRYSTPKGPEVDPIREVDLSDLILQPGRPEESVPPLRYLRAHEWRTFDQSVSRFLETPGYDANRFVQAVLAVHAQVLESDERDLLLGFSELRRCLDAFPVPAAMGHFPGIGWGVVFDDGTSATFDWTVCPGIHDNNEYHWQFGVALPYLASFTLCQPNTPAFWAFPDTKLYCNLTFVKTYGHPSNYIYESLDIAKENLRPIVGAALERKSSTHLPSTGGDTICNEASSLFHTMMTDDSAWLDLSVKAMRAPSEYFHSESTNIRIDLDNTSFEGCVARLPNFPSATKVRADEYYALLDELLRIQYDIMGTSVAPLKVSLVFEKIWGGHEASKSEIPQTLIERGKSSFNTIREDGYTLHEGHYYWIDCQVEAEGWFNAHDAKILITERLKELHKGLGPSFMFFDFPETDPFADCDTVDEWFEREFPISHPIGRMCGHEEMCPEELSQKLEIGLDIYLPQDPDVQIVWLRCFDEATKHILDKWRKEDEARPPR